MNGKSNKKLESKPSILKLISGGEKIMIEALDGTECIRHAKDVFAYIDEGFENWRLNKSGLATAETSLDVHEMVENGTYKEIFTSISDDFEKLVLTQAQIKKFCKKHHNWLRKEGYATFFLTKVGDEYFVVRVDMSPGGLGVLVDRFEYGLVWNGACRSRVVVPELDKKLAS